LRTPLFDELEETLGSFSTLPRPAQLAVTTVARALVDDPAVADDERDLATAVLVLALALR
jgi:hypothetical protein